MKKIVYLSLIAAVFGTVCDGAAVEAGADDQRDGTTPRADLLDAIRRRGEISPNADIDRNVLERQREIARTREDARQMGASGGGASSDEAKEARLRLSPLIAEELHERGSKDFSGVVDTVDAQREYRAAEIERNRREAAGPTVGEIGERIRRLNQVRGTDQMNDRSAPMVTVSDIGDGASSTYSASGSAPGRIEGDREPISTPEETSSARRNRSARYNRRTQADMDVIEIGADYGTPGRRQHKAPDRFE